MVSTGVTDKVQVGGGRKGLLLREVGHVEEARGVIIESGVGGHLSRLALYGLRTVELTRNVTRAIPAVNRKKL